MGAAAVTCGGQAAVFWQGQVAGARCSESLAEVGLPRNYCCLQVALLTCLLVLICASHAEHCRIQILSFSHSVTEHFASSRRFLSQNAPTCAARPFGHIAAQLSSVVFQSFECVRFPAAPDGEKWLMARGMYQQRLQSLLHGALAVQQLSQAHLPSRL